jgi:uncharacterized delta-60 repeat protein
METEMNTMLLICRAIWFAVALIAAPTHAQVVQQWSRNYNGTGNHTDQITGMVVDNSGNVIITGNSSSSNVVFTEDYVTIKYNSNGDSLWGQRYNGTGNSQDQPFDLAVDNSGNVYVTGLSVGSGTSSDYLTIKYNASGVQQWVQRYNGPVTGAGQDVAYAIAVDNRGNVYITGVSDTSRVGATGNCVTIKYNADGVQQWIAMYDGAGRQRDLGYDIAVDRSGNVYVTGYTTVASPNLDYLTIRYDSSGSLLWSRTYNGTGNDRDIATHIGLDSSGNVHVTGLSRSSAAPYSEDYVTMKYNSNGDAAWTRRFNSTTNFGDEPQDMAVDGAGTVYVTGFGTNGATFSTATVKYNSSGNEEWTRSNAGVANAYGLTLDNSGNVYVTGGATSGATRCFITKYNPAGVQQWMETYSGAGSLSDVGLLVRTDRSGNIFVGGNSSIIHGANSNSDFLVLKYSPPTSVYALLSEVVMGFTLQQNYPNPFNPATTIRFSIPVGTGHAPSVLKVYDVLGREVATLVNENLEAGSYETQFDASGFPSGVYFYRLTAGTFSETKRMLLLK